MFKKLDMDEKFYSLFHWVEFTPRPKQLVLAIDQWEKVCCYVTLFPVKLISSMFGYDTSLIFLPKEPHILMPLVSQEVSKMRGELKGRYFTQNIPENDTRKLFRNCSYLSLTKTLGKDYVFWELLFHLLYQFSTHSRILWNGYIKKELPACTTYARYAGTQQK